MSYSAVPTKATGETWSASDHNAYLRDNLAAMAPDIFTTKGDLFVASGANAGDRLAVGVDSSVLVADSAETLGVRWDTASWGISYARCSMSSDQVIPANTQTVINFDTVISDTDSQVTTGAAWSFTPISAGYYLVVASALIAAATNFNENNYAALYLFLNGSVYCSIASFWAEKTAVASAKPMNGLVALPLTTDDSISIKIFHNATTDASISVADGFSHVAISKIAGVIP